MSRVGRSLCQPIAFHRSDLTPSGNGLPGNTANHSCRNVSCTGIVEDGVAVGDRHGSEASQRLHTSPCT